MELAMAIVIAVLFAGGTYLILRPNLIRVVLGFTLYSNGANLLMITSGGYSKPVLGQDSAPFVNDHSAKGDVLAARLMDPLPPDIVLTAIVISFAVTALLLILAYRVYLDHRQDNPDLLPNIDDHDVPAHEPDPEMVDELREPRHRSARLGDHGAIDTDHEFAAEAMRKHRASQSAASESESHSGQQREGQA